MASKKKKPVDYRALKKVLNRYYDFTFKTPRSGKDFTPQQKSAISRKWKKIVPYIQGDGSIDKDEVSFLRYPEHSKLPHIDGVRTDRGIIYKFPQAELKKTRDGKTVVVVNPKIKKGLTMVQKRRDIFFPFPPSVQKDIRKIEKWVDQLKEKYGPHDIMWGYSGKRERTRYDPELFNMYFSEENLWDENYEETEDFENLDFVEKIDVWKTRKFRRKHEETPNFYNGVFFTYYL